MNEALNNNDPVFCTLLISGSQVDPCFQNKNSECRLTGGLCEPANQQSREIQGQNRYRESPDCNFWFQGNGPSSIYSWSISHIFERKSFCLWPFGQLR